jgi:hypothetical protein
VAVSTIGPWRATGGRSFWLSPESGRINLWCSVIHSAQILSEVVAQVFLMLSIGETTRRELSRAVE